MFRKAANRLARAYALKIYSARWDAPMNIQQKYHDQFSNMLNNISEEHADLDFSSARFWAQLEQYADQWWESRPFKGVGVDW